MSNFLLLGIALAGTFIGTYTDIKTRLVPDWTNYFMLVSGIGYYAIISALQSTYLPIAYSLIGAGAFFALGYVLYAAGAWGGGDAKMLTAFGAMFAPFPAVALWPFAFSLWLNIVIFGAIFGIIGMLILFLKNYSRVIAQLKLDFNKTKLIPYGLAIFGVTSAALALYETTFIAIFGIAILATLIFLFKSTEKICLVKKISPKKLVEGDWITHDIKIGNYAYKPKKSGLEKQDIEKLVELQNAGKLSEVEVKDGLPYVPAFLAALIVTITYGDLFYNLLSGVMGF